MDLSAHRTLYTGDCSYLFMAPELYNPGGGPYTARVFHDHIAFLASRGVDTYLANPNTWLAWFPSKTTPGLLDGYSRGDSGFFKHDVQFLDPEQAELTLRHLTGLFDRLLDLADAGIDWLAEIAKACHQRGVSPWLTVRMNDMHGSEIPEGSCLNRPLNQAGLRLSGKLAWPPGAVSPYYAGLNYACAEVRQYVYALIEELVESYDYEGLELDWLRNPLCCEQPASADDLALMTEFTASIRDLTRKRAQKTGKSYQLGIRMLGDIGQMRSIGLDVAGWVKNDLIDFVSPSNFFQGSWDMPFGNLRQEFGDDVAIFGVTEGIANWLNVYSPELKRERARPLPASIELLRGNAGGKLAMGVDGIECFNFFTADEPASREEDALGVGYDALAELADLEALRGKPKQYVLATQLGAVRLLYAETCEQLPAYLAAEYRGAFQVAMCAEIQLEGLELVIQIVVEAADRFFALGVSFNGTPPNFSSRLTAELLFPVGSYTSHSDGHMAFNFSFSVSQIRDGMNDIVVYNGSSNLDEDPVRILSVELGVKFATV